jgi:hypothetical protein
MRLILSGIVFGLTGLSAAVSPQSTSVELPAETNLKIRMIDGVDSKVTRVSQKFAASLDEPVLLNGETVIPRGADVVVKLTDAKNSGKPAGRCPNMGKLRLHTYHNGGIGLFAHLLVEHSIS